MNSNIPSDLLYTENHEWVKVVGKTVTVGITDFAQSSLGDIVFLELPEIGSSVTENSSFGVVESIKSVSDLYSPVDGTVAAINSTLIDTPENCNDKPYESWLVKITISGDLPENLMSAQEYTDFIQQSH